MSLLLWDDAAGLRHRLEVLGLPAGHRIILHENRRVMVSLTRSRGVPTIRIHRGFVYAPDRVLRAVVTFLTARASRLPTRRAQRELLAFPVDDFVPVQAIRPRQADRARPGDDAILRRLRASQRRLNLQHFGGKLPDLPIRLSSRMQSRLGELALDERKRVACEIALSRRHLRRDTWEEVEHTLLHEMVHQWQAEEGLAVDHGPAFRQKAREVGVEPTAKRYVASKRKAARYH